MDGGLDGRKLDRQGGVHLLVMERPIDLTPQPFRQFIGPVGELLLRRLPVQFQQARTSASSCGTTAWQEMASAIANPSTPCHSPPAHKGRVVSAWARWSDQYRAPSEAAAPPSPRGPLPRRVREPEGGLLRWAPHAPCGAWSVSRLASVSRVVSARRTASPGQPMPLEGDRQLPVNPPPARHATH